MMYHIDSSFYVHNQNVSFDEVIIRRLNETIYITIFMQFDVLRVEHLQDTLCAQIAFTPAASNI